MFGAQFYNSTTKRYVAGFGTLFNDIKIKRNDLNSNTVQTIPVPLHYAPIQKFLAMLGQDRDKDAPAITLPRMSFELMSMTYNPLNKLTRNLQNKVPTSSGTSSLQSYFAAIPYDLEFQLNIMAKNYEDGTKIIEQILPYFGPHFVVSMQVIDDHDPIDISIVLNTSTIEDTYETSFEERRLLVWTLSFTLKGYYFGPQIEKKVIKFVQADLYDDLVANDHVATVTVQPGLTANGEGTTSVNNSIAYSEINYADDWDYIVIIEEDSDPT